MEPTNKENIKYMEQCPRFEGCNIPRCPLDYWMLERTELPDEERCVLRGTYRSKRVTGNMTRKMGVISKFIREKKQKRLNYKQ